MHIKFIYSEKAIKILQNLHLTFDCMSEVKSKGKISQNFMAFSEYMNFTMAHMASLPGASKDLLV